MPIVMAGGLAHATLAIFTFTWAWGDFLWPLMVTNSDEIKTNPPCGAVPSTQTFTTWDGFAGSVRGTYDNGGSAVIGDFTLKVDATTVTSGIAHNVNPGTYVVSESGGPSGYTATISGDCDPTTGSVTVALGQHKACTITNDDEEQGIPPRTIGFWMNWSSCTGGNQDPVLDETLASFPGGGVLIGDLFVNNCVNAVRILSKSRISDGKKMASDPAFGLAAQLLAELRPRDQRDRAAAHAVVEGDHLRHRGHRDADRGDRAHGRPD